MDFLLYMGDVFTPINFALLVLGTVGGLVLGATPGLSPTMAVATGIACAASAPLLHLTLQRQSVNTDSNDNLRQSATSIKTGEGSGSSHLQIVLRAGESL